MRARTLLPPRAAASNRGLALVPHAPRLMEFASERQLVRSLEQLDGPAEQLPSQAARSRLH